MMAQILKVITPVEQKLLMQCPVLKMVIIFFVF